MHTIYTLIHTPHAHTHAHYTAGISAVEQIKEVHMTTNGVTLSHKLPQLRAAGLKGLNISLDTLVPAKFEFISRRKGNAFILGQKTKMTTSHFGAV